MNKNRQQVLTQAAVAHRETLRRNLQHRLEVVRAQGNEAFSASIGSRGGLFAPSLDLIGV
ncbi:MAG UNVERIFIED_CONTAM: hypothetical protein LVR29_18005 [Microcystis novacekii LVE1205-3]